MPRTYQDRLGRTITDPAVIEARRVVAQMRRLITLGVKAGRPWDRATTIGEVAAACKVPAQKVLDMIREYADAWLLGISDDSAADIGAWTVYQDGE